MSGSRFILPIVVLLFVVSIEAIWAGDSTNRVISLALKDQFDDEMILKPPFTRPVLVTVADRDGAGALDGWVQPLKEAFPGQIRFFAVADLRPVPAPLRGLVRRGFRKDYHHPVALDWHGDAVAQFPVEKTQPNLLLLDGGGRVAAALQGPATDPGLEKLKQSIGTLLGVSATNNPADPPRNQAARHAGPRPSGTASAGAVRQSN